MSPIINKPLKATRKLGFTLIELLIVITIIGILATMIFAGGNYAIKKARKTQAQNIAVGIMNACQNFETEYNRLPIPGSSGSDFEGDTGDSATSSVVPTLTGSDDTKNKKEIDFLDGIAAASGSPPAGGIDYVTDEANPVVVDPWSNFFNVYLDGDYDKKLDDPEGGTDQLHNTRIAVISAGEDGTLSGSNPEGGNAVNDNAKSY